MIAAPRPNDHRNPAILPNVFGTENSDSRIAALKGGWRTRFSPDLYTNLIGIALDFTSPPRPLDQAVSNPSRTTGPDGALWFTEANCVREQSSRCIVGNKIGRITTAGAVTEFTIPSDGSGPHSITTGPDGALWFTEYYGNRVGRLVLP